jgi:ABC-type Mn2+/Zn2+ transport system permease subunit
MDAKMNKTLVIAVVVGAASTFLGTWLYAKYAVSQAPKA